MTPVGASLRIVVTAVGGWGDVFPFIGVACALRDDGHDVVLAVNSGYLEVGRSAGLQTAVIGPPMGLQNYAKLPTLMTTVWDRVNWRLGKLVGLRRVLKHLVTPLIPQTARDLQVLTAEADVVVGHAMHIALPASVPPHVRWISASLFPGHYRSAHTSPDGRRWGNKSRWSNRVRWWWADWLRARIVDPPTNAARQAVGLTATRRAFLTGATSPDAVIVLSSELLTPRPADWPAEITLGGPVLWQPETADPLSAEVTHFLAGAGPVALVCFGSGSHLLPAKTYAAIVHALHEQGLRVLLLSAEAAKQTQPPGVLAVPYAPIARVLPGLTLVVHHGGWGTTCSALRAGVPQVIVPLDLSHDFNAWRLATLGLGTRLAPRRIGSRRAIARACREASTPQARERSSEFARRLLAEQSDGACTVVEAARSFSASRPGA